MIARWSAPDRDQACVVWREPAGDCWCGLPALWHRRMPVAATARGADPLEWAYCARHYQLWQEGAIAGPVVRLDAPPGGAVPPPAAAAPRRLYLAGPVTGHPAGNAPAFAQAADALRAAGYTVWVPPEEVLPETAWPDALRRCLPALCRQHGVAVLRGWDHSRGARLEVTVAQALGMPVYPWPAWVRAADEAAP